MVVKGDLNDPLDELPAMVVSIPIYRGLGPLPKILSEKGANNGGNLKEDS